MTSSSAGRLDFLTGSWEERMMPLHYSPWTCWKLEQLEFIAVEVVCVQYSTVRGPTDTQWNPDPTRISGKAPNIIENKVFTSTYWNLIFVNIIYPLSKSAGIVYLIQAGSILLYTCCLLVLLHSRECMALVFKSLVADGTKVTEEGKKMEKETKPSDTSNLMLFLS